MKKAFAIVLTILLLCGCASDNNHSGSFSEKYDSENNELAGVGTSDKTSADSDYDDYDLVILRYYNADPISAVADELTSELGWKIKIVTYDSDDYYKLNTKLMAGDSDFDIYIDSSSDFSKYIQNGFYCDLGQFDGLKNKIESNRIVAFTAENKGEYIGLPLSLRFNHHHKFQNSSPAILDYCAKNVDTLEKKFDDPDGEKLFGVLKYVYENNGDIKDDPRDYIDFSFVESSYCIMSPHSTHKEAAAEFLERVFDAVETMPESIVSGSYPDDEGVDLSNAYLTWKFMSVEVRAPIMDAYESTMQSDGSDKSLKKLAKEAAAEVAMRIEE